MTVTKIAELIWAFAALGLIILVLLHSPKGDGIGGIGGQAQLFTSTKSAEKTLNRVTWTLAIVFMGLTVILSANWLAQNDQVPAAASSVGQPQPAASQSENSQNLSGQDIPDLVTSDDT